MILKEKTLLVISSVFYKNIFKIDIELRISDIINRFFVYNFAHNFLKKKDIFSNFQCFYKNIFEIVMELHIFDILVHFCS